MELEDLDPNLSSSTYWMNLQSQDHHLEARIFLHTLYYEDSEIHIKSQVFYKF